MALAATLAAPNARASTIRVALPADPASCSAEKLVAAIHLRRPADEVRAGGEVTAGDVAVNVERGPGQWSLQVRGAGDSPLQRALPDPGADCVALADTAALMVDRYLIEVNWKGGPAVIAPLPPPEPPTPPVPWFGVLELAGGVESGLLALRPMVELGGGVQRGALRLELAIAGSTSESRALKGLPDDTTGPGTLSATAGRAELVAGWVRPLGPGALVLDAGPGVALESVSASGARVFHDAPATTTIPFLGARAAYELGLPARIALTLRADGRVYASTTTYSVDGSADLYPSSRFDGGISLGLSKLFF
ncbi:MAG: hypothetical protein JST54_31240 [Deltaproteobacteria bacterium]|nr:hypothetical protein [Deltaproteobacteria bacterium]